MADRPEFRVINGGAQPLPSPLEHENPNTSGNTVTDFDVERLDRKRDSLWAHDVTPEQLLKLALLDCSKHEGVFGCYITLIRRREEDGGLQTQNYRSGLNRLEEVAYRQLGLVEQLDAWRNGD